MIEKLKNELVKNDFIVIEYDDHSLLVILYEDSNLFAKVNLNVQLEITIKEYDEDCNAWYILKEKKFNEPNSAYNFIMKNL